MDDLDQQQHLEETTTTALAPIAPQALVAATSSLADAVHPAVTETLAPVIKEQTQTLARIIERRVELRHAHQEHVNARHQELGTTIAEAKAGNFCAGCGKATKGKGFCSNTCGNDYLRDQEKRVAEIREQQEKEMNRAHEVEALVVRETVEVGAVELAKLGKVRLVEERAGDQKAIGAATAAIAELETKIETDRQRRKTLEAHLADIKVKNGKPEEIESHEARITEAKARLQQAQTVTLAALYDERSAAQRRLYQVTLAWRIIRCQERDARNPEPVALRCLNCRTNPRHVSDDGTEQLFCSVECERALAARIEARDLAAERYSTATAAWRECVLCERLFSGDVPRVPVYLHEDAVQPTLADVCSLKCWSASVVDQDEAPSFEGVNFGTIPPISEISNLESRKTFEIGRPRTSANPILDALADGPLTTVEIAKATGQSVHATSCALNRLKTKDQVNRRKDGKWELV